MQELSIIIIRKKKSFLVPRSFSEYANNHEKCILLKITSFVTASLRPNHVPILTRSLCKVDNTRRADAGECTISDWTLQSPTLNLTHVFKHWK